MRVLGLETVSHVRPNKIVTILIKNNGTEIDISDEIQWVYKYTKEKDEYHLDKVVINKRRFHNGRIKATHGRHDERKRNSRNSN